MPIFFILNVIAERVTVLVKKVKLTKEIVSISRGAIIFFITLNNAVFLNYDLCIANFTLDIGKVCIVTAANLWQHDFRRMALPLMSGRNDTMILLKVNGFLSLLIITHHNMTE